MQSLTNLHTLSNKEQQKSDLHCNEKVAARLTFPVTSSSDRNSPNAKRHKSKKSNIICLLDLISSLPLRLTLSNFKMVKFCST